MHESSVPSLARIHQGKVRDIYDIDAQRLLWAGTTETFSPSNVRKDTKELAKLIIDALKQQRLI